MLSLAYLVVTLLIGDTFPKDENSQLDYKQLLGPALVIAINTFVMARMRKHPVASFAVSVGAMIVLALVLGDRAAAVTPLYWISILTFSIQVNDRPFFAGAFLGLCSDAMVSTYLRIIDMGSNLSLADSLALALQPLVNAVVSYGIVIALGRVVRNQRRHSLVDEVRIRQLKQERDLAVQKAVVEERTRMARELHDVSAHHLTAVMIQGKAAVEIFDTAPEEVKDLLVGVVDQGECALRSLRQLVDVLRIEPTRPQVPQPSIQSISSLIDGCRRSGLTVAADISGQLWDIESAIQVSCYRIVQESLSNVLRHAHGSRAVVSIKRDFDSIKICVENGPGQSLENDTNRHGLGLVGLKERAEYLGGTFGAGYSIRGTWIVQASVPLERTIRR
ncbi:sensor histidine kinase [Rhodococcus sp. NPDC056743]|uniref:sensor histidine kinase n=1 Tax=Rhodococcus sp. NPDC056743 TaxID=3345934 RepID=UPI00366D960A